MCPAKSPRPKKGGLPPGTLTHVGKARTGKVRVTVIDYSEADLEEREAASVEECRALRDTPTVSWINVDGIHDPDLIRDVGDVFQLHPLLLEDVMNATQRPKAEEFGEHMFVVIKMLYADEEGEISAEQVSLVVGSNFVLSFQEREGDVFEPVRERIRSGKGRIRTMQSDYLAYALIDAVVDNYFVILEGVGEQVDRLEDAIATEPNRDIMAQLRKLKRDGLALRRSVWPLREVINTLVRGESPLIHEETLPYLRDVYDHTIQVVDTVETFRDVVGGLRDTYLTVLSNKMNEVMKVLTIIATIFIPLTFIAGVYGMNFKKMPELNWPWGYPAALGSMVVVAGLMLLYFRRKKWL